MMQVLCDRPELLEKPCREWLIEQADPLWRGLLVSAMESLDPGKSPPSAELSAWIADAMRSLGGDLKKLRRVSDKLRADSLRITHGYEEMLATLDRRRRARYGVYYTPQRVVQFMVAQVDGALRREFGHPYGLGDIAFVPDGVPKRTPDLRSETGIRILDPAAGSGAFLVELLECADRAAQGRPAEAHKRDERLLKILERLHGWERMLPACGVAQLNIAARLVDLGFSFLRPAPLTVELCNSLVAPAERASTPPATPYNIVIGNPPFSGISQNSNAWIDRLMRGGAPEDPHARNYFAVDGRPLGERKVWLNDDYVKFFRLAQWLIDCAGAGILALVTNHSYLDNVTFRGMRCSLMDSFSRLTIVDLHGNRKRHERTASGQPDANVFNIAQGTAIALLRRLPREQNGSGRTVECADVWGSKEEKDRWLTDYTPAVPPDRYPSDTLPATTCRPTAPDYLWKVTTVRRHRERLIGLDEVMPFHCTAPVTARDHFVVAFSRSELAERLAEFADLTVPDQVVRDRYFRRTRSTRYAPGDTRGWSLSEARRTLAQHTNWPTWIRECLYRPFDVRTICWTPYLIDWPRPALMRHVDIPGNWCLITRRQMLPGHPANFFWATDRITIDGVVRSDNRGSELLLPIYVADGDDSATVTPNFSADFIHELATTIGLEWQPVRERPEAACFGPNDVACYLYGLFHLPQYRERYREALYASYPLVAFPRDANVFRRIASEGRQLARHHGVRTLTEEKALANECHVGDSESIDRAEGENDSDRWTVRQPRFDGQFVWINPHTRLAAVPDAVWQFRVGAHQPCRKWLADRRGRTLTLPERAHYRQLIAAVKDTLDAVARLNSFVEAGGGWSELFQA